MKPWNKIKWQKANAVIANSILSDFTMMEKATMKSAQIRAAEVCRKLGLPVIDDESGVAYQVILKAMQKHEADTRHACAEAVLRLPRGKTANTSEWDAINMNAAHAACMNAKVE